MKKIIIASLLLLNVNCFVNAMDLNDDFMSEMDNYSIEQEYTPAKDPWYIALSKNCFEKLPDSVQIGILVTLCTCDDTRKWTMDRIKQYAHYISNKLRNKKAQICQND